MPVYISEYTLRKDGSTQTVIRTKTQTIARIRECAHSINLVDGPTNASQAMRDIMDEQTVQFTFGSFYVMFEVIPHYMTVKRVGGRYEIVH